MLAPLLASALALSPARTPYRAAHISAPAAALPAVGRAALEHRAPRVATLIRMQEEGEPSPAAASSASTLLTEDASIYDEFLATDPTTGERLRLGLAEKEKLYLDCLDAFYNGGNQLLSDDEYEQLKQDLSFEGSRIASFSNKEIKFLIANKRYRTGEPVLSDKEYDALRRELKDLGSVVVLHDAPSCKADTGVCKMDMRVDQGKQRLLYLPGTVAGLVLVCELSFWTLHIDPLLSLVLGALPSYFFGKWFTENIFGQQPLVVQTACPNCNYLLTAYFGDLFNVQTDGIVGKAMPPQPQIDICCPNCKTNLKADRETMVISTAAKPEAVAAAAAASA